MLIWNICLKPVSLSSFYFIYQTNVWPTANEREKLVITSFLHSTWNLEPSNLEYSDYDDVVAAAGGWAVVDDDYHDLEW